MRRNHFERPKCRPHAVGGAGIGDHLFRPLQRVAGFDNVFNPIQLRATRKELRRGTVRGERIGERRAVYGEVPQNPEIGTQDVQRRPGIHLRLGENVQQLPPRPAHVQPQRVKFIQQNNHLVSLAGHRPVAEADNGRLRGLRAWRRIAFHGKKLDCARFAVYPQRKVAGREPIERPSRAVTDQHVDLHQP